MHIKNFGLSAWNDNDTFDDFDMSYNNVSILDGSAEDETKERRKEIHDKFYGE